MLTGIIAAMEEEVKPLREAMGQPDVITAGGFTFYRGRLQGREVVLLKSGIGKVSAAVGTTLLIERFAPQYIINTGSAGGMDPALSVGDLVLADRVCHHDSDLTGFGYEYGILPECPAFFTPDDALLQRVLACLQQLQGVHHRTGLIGSGDQFIHTREHIARLREYFPQLTACDMEAASIMQTCYRLQVPCVVIRAVSDIPGKENTVTFKQFLSVVAEQYTRFLLSWFQDEQNRS